jgi:glucose/arabinose dehydrogenase
MRLSGSQSRSLLPALALLGACIANVPAICAEAPSPGAANACPDDHSGLKLIPGFCATIFADKLGHPRHMVVAPNGVVYVNTWSGVYYGNDKPPAGGFVVALQDTSGTGKANLVKRFGETVQTGGAGGTGIALYKGALYVEINDKIVRYALPAGSIVPAGPAEVIVSGLPLGGDHPMHPFAIDADGWMYVDMGTATNACQQENRMPKSPGIKPCIETQTRGGIWRYDANKTNQMFSPAERYATGIRNADGIAIDSTGHGVYATQHGRDQLAENWPELYKPEQGATLPAEELLKVEKGGDYGWPECYYDPVQKKLVLAPEYGGDGGKTVGECAGKIAPIAAFQAHWAPDDLLLYAGKEFPARFQGGAFIAFHGSWNRAPFPQAGYNVTFQPLADGRASSSCEVFADGFAGSAANKRSGKALHRPTGLAAGPDGALYVSDDARGRIYKITYVGGESGDAHGTPCPAANASPGTRLATAAAPPEGLKKDAGAAANAAALPVPPGATQGAVALGGRVYHGQVASATCTGCHGTDGGGTALGPSLTAGKWAWSDGSLGGITKTIADGVAKPKNYRAPMPPMGGAQLTPDQLSAVAAYVWAIGHPKGQ